jgi:polysaccharide biosynthesis transport protein
MRRQESGYQDRHRSLAGWSPQSRSDMRLGYPVRSGWSERYEFPASQGLVDYWRVLWLKKFFILRFALLGLLLALCFSFLQKPVYRAHTSIAIQDQNENFLNLKEDPTAINPAGPTKSYFQTQVEILRSESLLERVIEKPALAQALAQEQTRGRRFDWRGHLGIPDSASSREPQVTIENVASRLSVRSFGEAHLVQVQFGSADPKLAADFANTLVSEFVDQSHQMRWESTQRTAEWLAAHLNEMKTNLEKGETQLQGYARDFGLVFSEKGNVAEDKLRQIQEQYSKAQVDRAEKQAKYETAMTKPAESLPEALDDQTVRALGLKLAELREQKAQLTSALTPEHYKVRQVQAQIDEVSSALETQRKNMVRRAANEYLSARRHEELLARAYEQQAKTVSDQAEKAIHYDTLKHEVDASRQLYDALGQRVKQAGIASAMSVSNILVVDKAKPPRLPYQPNYPLNCALGLLIGLGFGGGFSILRERLKSEHIVSPGVTPAHLNLPELGTIPAIGIPASRIRRYLSPQANSAESSVGSEHNGVNGGSELLKISLAEGGEDRAELFMLLESFRATVASLLLPAFECSFLPGVIVLTSPGPGAGKTTVTCNLGIELAEIGRRVLLVDADMRRPTLHQGLGLPNSWGLCDVLSSSQPIDQMNITGIVRQTDVPGLYLLPSGVMRKKHAALLYSPRLVELFKRLRQDFDLVLVDTAPVTLLADARVLGRIADGAVLVIRAGQSTLAQAELAVQRLAEDGTRILGTVLNGWDPKTASGTYYGDSYIQCKQKYQS